MVRLRLRQRCAEALGLPHAVRQLALAVRLGLLDLLDRGLGLLDHRTGRFQPLRGRVWIPAPQRQEGLAVDLVSLPHVVVRVAPLLGQLEPLRPVVGDLPLDLVEGRRDLLRILKHAGDAFEAAQETFGPGPERPEDRPCAQRKNRLVPPRCVPEDEAEFTFASRPPKPLRVSSDRRRFDRPRGGRALPRTK